MHELVHACYQADRLRPWYVSTYLWHRFVLRRSWKEHMMEREANRIAANWLNGSRVVFGAIPADLLAQFPTIGGPA